MKKLKPPGYILCTLLLFTYCTAGEPEIETFTDRIPQQQDERVISKEIMLEPVVNLTQLGIFSPGRINLIGDYIMWSDFRSGRLLGINPVGGDQLFRIGSRQGSGPGETGRISGFVLYDDRVVAIDRQNMKIIHWDYWTGEFITEFKIEGYHPQHLQILSDNLFVVQSMRQHGALFYLIDSTGEIVGSVADSTNHVGHPMKTAGHMSSSDDAFYFAGFSEPILRKYSSDGELLFSRATIDNYDTSEQYTETAFEGGGRAFGFADDARYAALYLKHYDGYLIAANSNNGVRGDNFIDIYDGENGDYMASWLTDRQVTGFAIIDDVLYTKGLIDDDIYLLGASVEGYFP